MEHVLELCESVPTIALLFCCYWGKTVTLTKILERFPYVLPPGAFASSEAQPITSPDVSFLDSAVYQTELLPMITSDVTPLQISVILGKKSVLNVLLEEAEYNYDLLAVNASGDTLIHLACRHSTDI